MRLGAGDHTQHVLILDRKLKFELAESKRGAGVVIVVRRRVRAPAEQSPIKKHVVVVDECAATNVVDLRVEVSPAAGATDVGVGGRGRVDVGARFGNRAHGRESLVQRVEN